MFLSPLVRSRKDPEYTMSIQKDMSKVKKPSDLSEDEYAILQAQGKLPKGFPFREDLVARPEGSDFSANTGTIAVMSTEDLEAELERRRAEETVPSIGDKGGISEDDEDDEDVPYEERTNKWLRAELASRDLDVNGNKDELVARLEESDAAAEGE